MRGNVPEVTDDQIPLSPAARELETETSPSSVAPLVSPACSCPSGREVMDGGATVFSGAEGKKNSASKTAAHNTGAAIFVKTIACVFLFCCLAAFI